MVDASRALTDKQENFVQFFVRGDTPEEAAEKAGYKLENGNWTVKATTLLEKRRIKEAIKNRWEGRTLYGKTRLETGIKTSVELLEKIIRNENIREKLRVKAAKELFDRAGITNKNWRSTKFNVSIKQNFSRNEKQELEQIIFDMQKNEDGCYEPE